MTTTTERLKRALFVPPPYTRGSVAANRIGLQPARMVYETARRSVLPGQRSADQQVLDACDALDRDGVAVIPNFLADDRFDAVRDAAVAWHQSDLTSTALGAEGPIHRDHHRLDWTRGQASPTDPEAPPFLAPILQDFGSDPRLRPLVASVMGTAKAGMQPDVVYEHLTLPPDAQDDTDNLLVLHADRHFPTVKMFLSLTDNGVDEGAFEYALGSHRMTRDRLAVEREYATWCACFREGRHGDVPDEALQNGRIGLTPDQWNRLGLEISPISVAPNSLIVANNRGFHRRGRMTPGHTRVQLRLIFHQLREPALAPLARTLASWRARG